MPSTNYNRHPEQEPSLQYTFAMTEIEEKY